MELIPRTKIDPSKITGKFPLLALFLLVIEVLLGFWLYQAESMFERVIVGFIMTFLLLAFLAVVKRLEEDINKQIIPQGLDNEVTPAQKEATEEEVDTPEPQSIGGPDRSYTINKPPKGWIVQELTFTDWLYEILRIKPNSSLKENEKSQVRDILTLNSGREMSIIPIPGKTVIDGRKSLTALEVLIPTRLSIIPMERWVQPPLFVEHSLTHNFFNYVGQILGAGVMTMREVSLGIIPNSKRRYLVAEFRQELENIIVDDKENKNINNNITIIGIEGDLRDHLLFMNYPSLPVVDDPDLKRNLQTLQSLVSSFRPLKVINPDKKKMKSKIKADKEFNALMKEKGKELFSFEFGITLLRIKDWDMNDPKKRHKVIKLLKPFEVFTNEIDLQDERLDALWNSLHQAEVGEASSFKADLKKFLTSVNDDGGKNINETVE